MEVENEKPCKSSALSKKLKRVDTWQPSEGVFDNLPDFVTAAEACRILNYSRETIYAWRKKPERYNPPKDLFQKFKGRLWLRTKVLKRWFKERNKL